MYQNGVYSLLILAEFAFFLTPCGVTAHTILKVCDTLFQVFGTDFLGGVLMTVVASVGFECALIVADIACEDGVGAVIEWESMVAEGGRFPGGGGVALRAGGAELTFVDVGFGMTGNAFGRCAREAPIHVAGFALQVHVCAGEREVRLVVVEGGLLPRARCVALLALRAEAAVVRVIFEVTTGARRLQAREGAAPVAGFAL